MKIFCVLRVFSGLLASLFLFFCMCADAHALRVISLYPGHTDNIAAMGGEALLVARSHNDDLESLENLPRLPLSVTPEAILAHRPDILIMRTLNAAANPNLAPVLERAGVEVHVVDPPTWDGFEDYLRKLAGIVGLDPGAALNKLDDLRNSAQSTQKVIPEGRAGRKPRVFLEATSRELYTCSRDSWAAHVIRLCGGENASGAAAPLRPGSALAPWGVEKAVGLAGKIDVYLVQQGAMNVSTREDVLSRPWFRAFGEQSGVRLEFIPERYLSRPSLIGLERGVEILRALFYPAEPD